MKKIGYGIRVQVQRLFNRAGIIVLCGKACQGRRGDLNKNLI
jgi:hypothetical protein